MTRSFGSLVLILLAGSLASAAGPTSVRFVPPYRCYGSAGASCASRPAAYGGAYLPVVPCYPYGRSSYYGTYGGGYYPGDFGFYTAPSSQLFQATEERLDPPAPVLPAPPARTASSQPNAAEVDLTVPADAVLWVQGVQMNQAGPVRLFVSPPLPVGQPFDYEVRAVYKEGSQQVTTVRTLQVRAGQRVQVNLMSLPTVAAK